MVSVPPPRSVLWSVDMLANHVVTWTLLHEPIKALLVKYANTLVTHNSCILAPPFFLYKKEMFHEWSPTVVNLLPKPYGFLEYVRELIKTPPCYV